MNTVMSMAFRDHPLDLRSDDIASRSVIFSKFKALIEIMMISHKLKLCMCQILLTHLPC